MKEIARIQIRGNDTDLASYWNKLHPETPIRYGIVVLPHGSAIYDELRKSFARFATHASMEWSERITVEYTPVEIRSCEILELVIIGYAGDGGSKYAPVYREVAVCPSCNIGEYQQLQDVLINTSSFESTPDSHQHRKCDWYETRFGEIIVSRRLYDLFKSMAIPGVVFRPVRDHANGDVVSSKLFQLVVEEQIGPLMGPTQFERDGFCAACNRFRSVLRVNPRWSKGSELYLPRLAFYKPPIMRTSEAFGRRPYVSPALLINQSLYRSMRAESIYGFRVLPAHLVDVAAPDSINRSTTQ